MAGPRHVELAERGDLLEGHGVLPVQVEQGEEGRDDLVAALGIRGELAEAGPAQLLEQAAILAARLRRVHRATFRRLTADCAGLYEVVARFLAVLELYREGNVVLEQAEPLGDLYVTWSPGAEEDG